MRLSTTFRLVLLVATLGVSACETQQVPTRPQANELVGSWRVITERVAATGVEIIWKIDDRHIVITDGDGNEISRSEYRIDPSQKPKHINMTIRDDKIVEDRPGIYQIADGRLRLTFSVDGSARPTKFDDRYALMLNRID
ncbi:MAG TPA: TIGR03067 domain-containing protein [Lacipirellulaceae bacterium]|jgi:uncharacterized protein (TIGR03067 family)|nr:TIGR03067 domain-containing protein [Lacipirellulaceae bacterium]